MTMLTVHTSGPATYEPDGIRALLVEMVKAGGPREDQFGMLKEVMDSIAIHRASGLLNDADIVGLWESLGEVGTPDTLMGFIYRRPHGYHGDFEIIDRMYCQHVATQPHLASWDRWIQSLPSTRAVRNRKDLFVSVVVAEAARMQTCCLLNVGSGPCRDLLTALDTAQECDIRATCVDLDSNAHRYAAGLLGQHGGSVSFRKQNVLRLRDRHQFDLAWSAGLFDYLSDRLFVAAFKRMYEAVRPGGRIVIGNFATGNPSRSAMEFGGWRLHHRTSKSLLALVQEAQVAVLSADVLSEPLGVNLFLSVRKVT